MLSAVKSSVPGPAVASGSAPEITPPSTRLATALSTETGVAADRTIGTSNVFEAEGCDDSIEVNETVLPLLAEIE